MRFLEIIYQKKFSLISIFLFLYVMLNLLDGERGLISYYEKLKLKDLLGEEKKSLTLELNLVEKKNSLLTDIVDIDYLETLYRKKFMVGKLNEKIYFLGIAEGVSAVRSLIDNFKSLDFGNITFKIKVQRPITFSKKAYIFLAVTAIFNLLSIVFDQLVVQQEDKIRAMDQMRNEKKQEVYNSLNSHKVFNELFFRLS